MNETKEYVLGVNERELARLELQQQVWGEISSRFLDRVNLRKGMRVLDLGCGPGFMLEELQSRIGETGSILALDESPVWMEYLQQKIAKSGWRNVQTQQSRIEEARIEPASFNFIFARWVLSFPPNPEALVKQISSWIKPGGVFAVQDYNHEGISLFPESEGFRAVVQGTRKLYRSGGGDPWVGARLPRFFEESGLALFDFNPTVICGGPDSPAFRWADSFFPVHSQRMVELGHLSTSDRELMLKEWEEHRKDPHSRFFSPILLDIAGRKTR